MFNISYFSNVILHYRTHSTIGYQHQDYWWRFYYDWVDRAESPTWKYNQLWRSLLENWRWTITNYSRRHWRDAIDISNNQPGNKYHVQHSGMFLNTSFSICLLCLDSPWRQRFLSWTAPDNRRFYPLPFNRILPNPIIIKMSFYY